MNSLRKGQHLAPLPCQHCAWHTGDTIHIHTGFRNEDKERWVTERNMEAVSFFGSPEKKKQLRKMEKHAVWMAFISPPNKKYLEVLLTTY